MAEKVFKRNAKKIKENTGWVIIQKDGTKSKKPPEGVPPFEPKPYVSGEGCSSENGIPCVPILDEKVRKRARR